MTFEIGLALWGWLLIALACAGVSAYAYHRLQGGRWLRLACAGLRFLLLLVLCLLLAGPQQVIRNDSVTPYSVGVLVDRSGSMGLSDVVAGDDVISRTASIRAALNQRTAWTDDQTLNDRRLRWFNTTTTSTPAPAPGSGSFEDQSLAPDSLLPGVGDSGVASGGGGGATALPEAFDRAWGLMAGEPVGAVVMVSDGRSQQPVTESWLEAVKRRGVPVVVVPAGPAEPLTDIAVDRVTATDEAYVGDPVPIWVTVRQRGGDAVDPVQVSLRLIDTETGEVVNEVTHAEQPLGEPVELTAVSERAGRVRYAVEAVLPGEKVTVNNRERVDVAWIDDPIQVLYVEAYPRWEYRYLASALTRETSIESSMLLVASARGEAGRFVQEGDKPIQRVPNTARELSPYDVVILGDVPVTAFGQDQLDILRAHVAEEGAGLILIGGPEQMPTGWATSPLAALLPMTQPAQVRAVPGAGVGPGGRLVRPTEDAARLGLMRLRGPDVLASDDVEGWPNVLSPLLYTQQLGELKPAVQVLSTQHDYTGPPEKPGLKDGEALMTWMPFGAGTVVFAGTDETWRYRRGRGGLYFEQHWIQLVRTLGQKRVQQTGAGRAALSVSNPRVAPGSPVAVTVRLTDPELIDRRLTEVVLEVSQQAEGQESGPAAGTEPMRLRLVSQGLPMDTQQAASQRFEALWTPKQAGRYTLKPAEALAGLSLEQRVTVVEDTPEMNDTRTDHAALRRIAEASGGVELPLDAIDTLPQVLEELGVPQTLVQTDELRRPLWNSLWSWLLVLSLLTGEWVLRKLVRLV